MNVPHTFDLFKRLWIRNNSVKFIFCTEPKQDILTDIIHKKNIFFNNSGDALTGGAGAKLRKLIISFTATCDQIWPMVYNFVYKIA
jgi:hypothetical protein